MKNLKSYLLAFLSLALVSAGVTAIAQERVNSVTGAPEIQNNPTLGYQIDYDKLINDELLDEDDLTSDSDTQGATQQSIKAYVDASVSDWEATDFTTATATFDVSPDNLYRNNNGGATTWNISSGADLTDGDRFIIDNQSANILTLNHPLLYDANINTVGVLTTLAVPAYSTYTFSTMTGGALKLVSTHGIVDDSTYFAPTLNFSTDNFSGSVSNNGTAVNQEYTFTPDTAGFYILRLRADTVVGNGWVRVGTTGGSSFDVFDGAAPTAQRLFPTELDKTYLVEVEEDELVPLTITIGAGGGSSATGIYHYFGHPAFEEEGDVVDERFVTGTVFNPTITAGLNPETTVFKLENIGVDTLEIQGLSSGEYFLPVGEIVILRRETGSNILYASRTRPEEQPDLASLESLGSKLHAVYSPSIAGFEDLTVNDRDLTTSLGTVAQDADGNLVFSNGDRLDIDTNGDGSGLWIYARVSVNDAGGHFSVFGNTTSFLPLAQNGSPDANVIRLNNVSNTIDFSIDGVDETNFANRNQVYDAMNGLGFVTLGVENIPNGTTLSIGDHPQNNNFDFDAGILGGMVILNEAPTDEELEIINYNLENGINVLSVPNQATIDSTKIADGVMIDAAPAWEGSFVLSNSQSGVINTGVNLDEVDEIIVSFSRNVNADGSNLWAAPTKTIRIEDIILNVPQGVLITHFDNQFLAIANMTTTQKTAGDIPFQANSGSTTFGYEVNRIEFKKRAVGVSSDVGQIIVKPSTFFTDDDDAIAQGFLPLKDITVPNGAIDYPIVAQGAPFLVSGNDLVVTSEWAGIVIRNLGGLAGAEGVFQADATAPNGLNVVSRFNRQENTPTGGGAFRLTGTGSEINVNGVITGDNETRMANMAFQYYMILDSYHEIEATPTFEAQDLLREVRIESVTPASFTTNAPFEFDDITPHSDTFQELFFEGTNNRTLVVPAGYDLDLEADIAILNKTSNGGMNIGWYDVDNAINIGTVGHGINTNHSSVLDRDGVAYYYERTTTERRFELRLTDASSTNSLTVNAKINGSKVQKEVVNPDLAEITVPTYFYGHIEDGSGDTSVSNNDTLEIDLINISKNPENFTFITTGLTYATPTGGTATGAISRALKVPATITDVRNVIFEFYGEFEPETTGDESFSVEMYKNGQYVTKANAVADADSGSTTISFKDYTTLTGGDEFAFKAINIDDNDDQEGINYLIDIQPEIEGTLILPDSVPVDNTGATTGDTLVWDGAVALESSNTSDLQITAPINGTISSFFLTLVNSAATSKTLALAPAAGLGGNTITAQGPIPANSTAVIEYVFGTPVSVTAGMVLAINPSNDVDISFIQVASSNGFNFTFGQTGNAASAYDDGYDIGTQQNVKTFSDGSIIAVEDGTNVTTNLPNGVPATWSICAPSMSVDSTILTADLIQDANRTQDFGNFTTDWNNLGNLNINLNGLYNRDAVVSLGFDNFTTSEEQRATSIIKELTTTSPVGVGAELRFDGNVAQLAGTIAGNEAFFKVDNAGNPLFLGEATAFIKTRQVEQGNALVGQVLTLTNATTGEIEYTTVTGGSSVTVEDLLTSTSATNALSANQGNVLDGRVTTNTATGVTNAAAAATNATNIVSIDSEVNAIDLNLVTGDILRFTDNDGVDKDIDLSTYLDDTNLARITGVAIDAANLVTFTRDDATTVSLNLSNLANNFATVVPPPSDDATGAVGTSTDIARADHKHAAQLPSSDANNLITVGSDDLHSLSTTNAPAAGQVLSSNGDGTFSWVTVNIVPPPPSITTPAQLPTDQVYEAGDAYVIAVTQPVLSGATPATIEFRYEVDPERDGTFVVEGGFLTAVPTNAPATTGTVDGDIRLETIVDRGLPTEVRAYSNVITINASVFDFATDAPFLQGAWDIQDTAANTFQTFEHDFNPADVDATNNTIDFGGDINFGNPNGSVTSPIVGVPVRIRTTGTLPSGIMPDTDYLVKDVSPDIYRLFKISDDSDRANLDRVSPTEIIFPSQGFLQDNLEIDLTDAGTGVHTLYTGELMSSWDDSINGYSITSVSPTDKNTFMDIQQDANGKYINLETKFTPPSEGRDDRGGRYILGTSAQNLALKQEVENKNTLIQGFVGSFQDYSIFGEERRAINTATSQINISTNTLSFSVSQPFFVTGSKVELKPDAGSTLPTGLSQGVIYYAIKDSTTSLQLAASEADATAGTAIDITGSGSGVFSLILTEFVNDRDNWGFLFEQSYPDDSRESFVVGMGTDAAFNAGVYRLNSSSLVSVSGGFNGRWNQLGTLPDYSRVYVYMPRDAVLTKDDGTPFETGFYYVGGGTGSAPHGLYETLADAQTDNFANSIKFNGVQGVGSAKIMSIDSQQQFIAVDQSTQNASEFPYINLDEEHVFTWVGRYNDPAASFREVDFYIDGVLQDTLVTNIAKSATPASNGVNSSLGVMFNSSVPHVTLNAKMRHFFWGGTNDHLGAADIAPLNDELKSKFGIN